MAFKRYKRWFSEDGELMGHRTIYLVRVNTKKERDRFLLYCPDSIRIDGLILDGKGYSIGNTFAVSTDTKKLKELIKLGEKSSVGESVGDYTIEARIDSTYREVGNLVSIAGDFLKPYKRDERPNKSVDWLINRMVQEEGEKPLEGLNNYIQVIGSMIQQKTGEEKTELSEEDIKKLEAEKEYHIIERVDGMFKSMLLPEYNVEIGTVAYSSGTASIDSRLFLNEITDKLKPISKKLAKERGYFDKQEKLNKVIKMLGKEEVQVFKAGTAPAWVANMLVERVQHRMDCREYIKSHATEISNRPYQ